MRKSIVILMLIVGSTVLGATVLREPIAQAASPFTNVIIGNTAANPIPVAEQNLDGGNNIRVHEQGTAAVHEQGVATVHVDNGSLPVSGTVNVGNSDMRVMHVASNETIPANTARLLGFRDTSDCRALAAFVKPGDLPLANLVVGLELSVTGTVLGDTVGAAPSIRLPGSTVWYFSSTGGVPFFSPKAELEIVNTDQDAAHTITDAWLICQR
jgi:hypothetical protein